MSGLSTVSVRLRVTVGVIATLALVLVALSLAVTAVFTAQSERNLDALLNGRAQLARQLARAGVGPQQIVNRVSADGVQASLTLRNQTVVGGPIAPGGQVRTVTTRLAGSGRVAGATLTLAVDASLVRDGQAALRRLLLVGSLIALVVSAGLVVLTVRLGLRPLDRVAALAREITGGRRGHRLRPTRTDTEIGQTAQALDAMLDELEGAEARARAAEQTSRTFLADAAHELRTPLAGVRAAAETLLHAPTGSDPEQRQHLEVLVVREAQRAQKLVDDLLAAARLDAGTELHTAPTALGALAAAEVERARLLVPRARVQVVGPDVVAECDADQVTGILRNLVDNALRAAGPDGTVQLVLGVDATPPASAVVEVVDDGPGVPPADRERIFERLVRLDTSRTTAAGGSGLGLAIARGRARAHGGELTCEEPAGRGARFRLRLPLVTGPAPEPPRG